MQTLTLTQLHNILRNAYVLCNVMEYDGTAARQFVQQANVFASLQSLYWDMQYKWEQHTTYDSLGNCDDSATAIPLDDVCNAIAQHLVYWDDEWDHYFKNVCTTVPDVANYKQLHS